MTFWWLIWRFFVISLAFGLISIVWIYFWSMKYIWSDNMISDFKTPEFSQEISKISYFLSGSYLRYSPSEWFTTNKTWVLFQEDGSTLEVNISWDANRRYNSEKKWVWITNKYIYIDTNNGRSQSISRDKLMNLFISTWGKWVSDSYISSNIYIDSMFTGTDIISGDTIYIDANDSDKLIYNINNAIQNPKFRLAVKWDTSLLMWLLSIPLTIVFIIFTIMLLIIYIIIFLIYVLSAWLVWSIMWNINTFDKAVSFSRIPFIIKEIIQISFWLDFLVSLIIFVLIIAAISYKFKNIETTKE